MFRFDDPDLQVEVLYRLRRSAHRAIAVLGEQYWEKCRLVDGGLPGPPAIAALPASRQPGALAADEAARIAGAHPYALDEAATTAAVTLSEELARLAPPRAEAGTSRVDHVVAVTPPTDSGFVRFASGVGYTCDGIPLVACHWGPLPQGTWLSWWADNRIAIHNDVSTLGISPEQAAHLLREMGSLTFGDCATTIYTDPDVELPDRRLPLPPPQAITQGRALTDIAHAAWALLTFPGAAHLITRPPTPAQANQDRRAGLHPRPATLATEPVQPAKVRWPK